MAIKCIEKDVWLPERENYLQDDIKISKRFGGLGTVQFKKFQKAFGHFKQFRTAIDVGGNVGLWSRVMSLCFENVEAFEPNPECYDAFIANQPHSNVMLHRVGLSNQPGELRFDNSGRSTGFTHVSKDGPVLAEVRTLDSYNFTKVDFIKIDVEGWEYPVVLGGESTIRSNKPTIIVEQKPNNAERVGFKQYQASKLLQKWGAELVADVGGDLILHWPDRK